MKTKFFTLFVLLATNVAYAADNTPSKEVAPDGEQVDVSKVTEKYWAQGKDTELGVVQNRKYTNEHKFELDLFVGSVSTDPFLSVHNYGASLGYYFNQYFSAHVTGWKDSTSNSAAYDSFQNAFPAGQPKAALYLNRPTSFYGGEVNENLLYGKASFFGNAIIYVDIFALAGAGVTNTDNGKNFTYFAGLGQKIHLNKYMSLNLDYRIMFFNETLHSTIDNTTQKRSNTTDAITLGLGFFY